MKKKVEKLTIKNVKWLVFIFLVLFTGAVWGQAINSVIAQSPVHFAENSDFSAGELTITFNMPAGQTTGELKVNLATGIEYLPGSVTATGATIALKSGSTNANKPEFSLTGASGVVKVTLKRKVTKAVLTNAALASGLFDEAILTVGGVSTNPPAKNAPGYELRRPTLAVQLPTTQTDVLGARTETFDIRNTGNGIVKDVYFSIAYDHRDVIGGSVSHNGTLLTPVGTVPVGLPNAGKPIYKIPNANLANNGVVTITEKYTVDKCTTGRQNTYYAYWGSGIANSNDIFETNSNTRNISVSTGTPIIKYNGSNAFTYFEWKNGFCGNILGTYYVRYDNVTADAKGTAYNLEIRLFDADESQKFSRFEPVDIRLIAKNGTTIPLAATLGTEDTRRISLSNLPALSDTSLGATDFGLTDADNDGFRDDLKKGDYFQIAFDLKKKEGITCLQPRIGVRNFLSIQPRSQVLSSNVCGDLIPSEQHILDYSTLRVYFNGVNDASKLPAQLVQNVPSAAYIAPGMNWPSLGAGQRLKNGNVVNVERQFKYVITTPAGMKLQNVKLYSKANVFGVSTEAAVNQPDIEPNSTRTIITNNQPSDSPFGTPGYLTFDVLLQNCNGGTAPITYSVYMMLKNGDGTYCDIPLVCNQVTNVPTICSTPCAIQGPRMLSTKVERADNSYGWKDHTMAIRQTRANVSPIERMRALYLDDIEFISEGQQHVSKTDTNLFYYVKVEKTAELEPKKITLKVNGGSEQILIATTNNPMRGTNAAGKKYFRWNLTSLLPASTLVAGATFSTVATYQVKNANNSNSNDRALDVQSGTESFFYTLDNPTTDTNINAEGYHTAQKHCGTNLTPVFYIAETRHLLATNRYTELSGCDAATLGSNLIYAARRFKPGGTYFSQEFRPARLIKKITIKMPSAYQIKNMQFTYTYKMGAATAATVDMSKLIMTDDGTWKTYTYENPPKGTLGYLPPGMITVENEYNEYIKAFIQPSCKAKTVDVNKTIGQQEAEALTKQEKIDSKIEYEDFYYHYADTGDSSVAVDLQNDRPILFAANKKPEITIEAISQLTVKANKRTMEATFKLKNAKSYDAPFGWISVPDVAGIEVLSLEETTPGNTYTYIAKNTITGEKMFFLSDKGNDGKVLKNTERQFKLKYKITNCAAALQLKVYAGWNCNENPTSGYRNTCSDKFITYNIAIALSKKEIAADPGNPGENDPNKKGSIPMCTATPYTYVINSAEEGDIYNAKLVVTQGNGITISNVQVEYPLGGTVYTVGTGAGKILHTQSGNRHTYDISNILPEGSLPGSLNEPNNANKRKFKLTFDVTPDCDFSAGSSFDIDIEGNNLCGTSAEGDKTRAIIAGIAGVNINDYTITLDPLTYVSGNGTLCGGGVVYKTRVTVNSSNSTFQMGPNARLRFTIPEGYELAPSFARYYGRTPYGPGALWANPVRKQAEEKTLASGSELVMEIPAGMKNGQFFEFGIHIIQKADALIDCDITNPKKLKVIATDTKTGVMCGVTACPPMTVSTSKEEKVVIKNERPKLSLKDVSATSTAQAGKENLTIKYKIENGTGTDVATFTNRTAKAALYYDANHNNIVDTGDIKLTDHTTSALTLAQGATSDEQSFTFAVDQDKVCRLLLVLKNEDNVCLCGDVVASITAPTQLTGLVDNITVCESETKKVAYSAAGASYDQYTWTGKTANDKLDYLSAANVKEPNFHYNGTKLTTTQTFTYVLTVKRTNGCEATQEVKITVQPAPGIANISVAPSPYCPGDTAEKLTVTPTTYGVTGTLSYQWYRNTTDSNTGGTEVGTNSENYTPETGSSATFYYYVKVTNSTCGEVISNTIKVVVKPTPDQPTVSEHTAATCTTISKAKITNVKPTTQVASYTFVNTETNRTVSATVDRTTGEISNLPVGKYRVTAIQEGCEKQSGEFEIEGFKAKPEKPKVSTEAQCDNPSKAEITNVKPDTEVTAYTFKNVETSAIVTATVDRTTGEVSALPVGKYKVTATNSDGCTQESDLFEIKAAKGHPDKPVLSTTESCNTLSLAKIENYQSSQSYTFVKADGTPLTGITVATNGVVNNLTIGTYKVKTTREGCDSDLSDTFEIKAKKAATAITTQPQGHNYAKNATADAITVVATGEGTLSYKWFMNTTNSRTGADVTEVATTASYTPAINTVGSSFYWVEVTGGCGTEKSRIVEIKVTENIAPIEANDDTATVRRGQSVPVLPNDFAGGNPATLTNVTIAIDSNDGLTGATIDPQGRIKVPTNATPRTYNVVYKICLVSDPNTCKNATAKITVTNDPAYTIEANDDPLTRVAKGGTVNVLSNDQVNGNPATPTALDMTIEDNGGLANLEVNTATGKLKVPAGATSGTYEVTYRICVKGEASPCDTAKVKIEVTSDAAPTTTINANDDPNTSVAKGGSVEVLSNDRLNGEPVTKDKVTTTIDNDGGLTGVEIDPATGKIKVPVTATEGTYEVTYKICEKQNGTPCDTAKVKITVTSDVIHTIEANDDPEVTVGKGGTVTVLNNDTVDGTPATKDNVDISIVNHGNLTGLTVDSATGKLKVPAHAAVGSYEVTYRICLKGASAPCDTAKVKITISGDSGVTITANNDPLTQVTKGGTADVLSNDRLGGDPATKDNVIVTIDSDGGLTGVDIDTATGKIKIPDNATPGEYEVTYKICEKVNNSPCAMAKIKLKVTDDPAATPTIQANDDPDTPVRPGDKVDILSNDRLNGDPATKDKVMISIDNDGGLTGVSVDAQTGKIQIPTDAPARTYEITYKICEKQNGTPCATAKVKVSVDNDTIRTIEANNDPLTRVAKGGTVDILSNDKVDGRPADKDKVNFSIENSGRLVGVTIEPTTGKIKVPANATPGTYEVTYKICHKQQAGLCDTAIAKIEVTDVSAENPMISANDDPETKVPKGGTIDILSNDRIGGNPATKDNVVPSIDNDGGLPGVTIDSNTGKIQIPTSATPGTYEVTYKICERQNGTPCATAKVKIEVTGDSASTPTITANNDPEYTVPAGGMVDILSNDRVNGDPVSPSQLTITIVNKGGLPDLIIDPASGKLKVPDTASAGGPYEVTYRICLSPAGTPCDEAKAIIKVSGAPRRIEAKDDDLGRIPNAVNYTSTHTVFSKGVDTLEGVSGVLKPGEDVILVPGTAPHADISMDTATGKITIKAGTPAGQYEYQYTICEKNNQDNCSNTATVRFEVKASAITANDDKVWKVGTKGGLTPSILNNDILNGKTGLSQSDVEIGVPQGETNDVVHFKMNEDGRIKVEEGLNPGPYTYHYVIKDKANENVYDTAKVTIEIVSFAAADDEFTEINNQDQPKTIEESVLKNDELDGRTPQTTTDVYITPGVFKDNNNNPVDYFTFDTTTGKITIKPHTPNGTYSFSYTICKKGTSECADPAQVTIKLEAVEAVDDDYSTTPVNTVGGAKIIGNVLDNDRYQGGPAIDHKDRVVVSRHSGDDRIEIKSTGEVIVPQGMPAGTYELTYQLCLKESSNTCDTAKITVVVFEDKPLVIHNGISADGDGHNDSFIIEGIELYPDNNLKIFNRWGVLVYEKDGYRNDTEPFDGHSNGRATINASSKLPQGTYYYILDYKDTTGKLQQEKGWLYLKY